MTHKCTPACPWSYPVESRLVWVEPKQVLEHYGWAKTKGYEYMRAADFAKKANGKFRLDTLLRWEDLQLGLIPPAVIEPVRTLPESRRGKRAA